MTRTQFVKQCGELNRQEHNFTEALKGVISRCDDVPQTIKDLEKKYAGKNLPPAVWKEIMRLFICRGKTRAPDNIATEANQTIAANFMKNTRELDKYFSKATKLWAAVEHAFEVCSLHVPRAASDTFLDSFVSGLPESWGRSIMVKMVTARNNDLPYSLNDAFNAALAHQTASHASHTPIRREQDRGDRSQAGAKRIRPLMHMADDDHHSDESAPDSPEKCRDFSKGTCKRGRSCNFSHNHDDDHKKGSLKRHRQKTPERMPSKRPRTEQRACHFYEKGTCRAGDKCTFSHEGLVFGRLAKERDNSGRPQRKFTCFRCDSENCTYVSCTSDCIKCAAKGAAVCEIDCPAKQLFGRVGNRTKSK